MQRKLILTETMSKQLLQIVVVKIYKNKNCAGWKNSEFENLQLTLFPFNKIVCKSKISPFCPRPNPMHAI